MEKKEIIKQLEMYSNAIIGFIVLEGLVFCYTFGQDMTFNAKIKGNVMLSIVLIFAFSVILISAVYANRKIGKKLGRFSSEYGHLVESVYRGKGFVIYFFGLAPILITLFFGGLIKIDL